MLELTEVSVAYRRTVKALHGVSLTVPPGKIVAVLGSNGAGKSTLMRAVSRVLPAYGGVVTGGEIRLDGRPITRSSPAAIVHAGVVQIPEGRGIFTRLTVEENLRAGGLSQPRSRHNAAIADVHALFPELVALSHQRAGLLSGGEQQMLAVGRALMGRPRLLLLDEPSLGLAPHVVARIGAVIGEINAQGTTVMLVEQNAAMALELASEVCVLRLGQVALTAPASELRHSRRMEDLYLGGDLGESEAVAAERPLATAARTLSRWEG